MVMVMIFFIHYHNWVSDRATTDDWLLMKIYLTGMKTDKRGIWQEGGKEGRKGGRRAGR